MENTESTQLECPPNSFSYGNSTLYLSDHAFNRMLERGRCYSVEDVQERLLEILSQGYECDIRKKGCKKERTITHKDLVLHVKENTITTVKYNKQFFMAGAA